jgi:hypothetical protein
MGIVGRKGKLSIAGIGADIQEIAWERYEDILTADVFGAFRYLPTCLGILPMLEHPRDEHGQTFSAYLERFGIALSTLDIARIRFWPMFSDGREPDVFVLLESTVTGQSVALLVEAKLHAPQHEIPTAVGNISQLGHYLTQHLADNYSEHSIAWQIPDHPRPLLFITNHAQTPAEQLERARREASLSINSVATQDLGVFWTNWATLGGTVRELWHQHRANVDREPWLRLLLDLYEDLRERDLLPRPRFVGFERPFFCALPPCGYRRGYRADLLSNCGMPNSMALRTYVHQTFDVPLPYNAYARRQYIAPSNLARPLSLTTNFRGDTS